MDMEPSQDAPLHIPVMTEEVISLLEIIPEGIYVDGTVGLGGHATQIISRLSSKGQLVGIDLDEDALQYCEDRLTASSCPFKLIHNSYDQILRILSKLEISKVNGILLDLGISSLQLNSKDRGFSFSRPAPLDMRFDRTNRRTAADVLNKLSEPELSDVFYTYGEERRSRSIAKKISQVRPLFTVSDLVEAVRSCTPPNFRHRTLARVFQALRIVVNKELEKLEIFLNHFIEALAIGGKVVIISFHSLEDRLVKQHFKQMKENGRIRILTKKPLQPKEDERKVNTRSRSAKLRAAERIS